MKITPFMYESKKVRILTDEQGLPWWVARDVCAVLGYSDTEAALRKIEEDEKLTRSAYVSGQQRQVWTVNEPGLYTLIIRSNKPEAKKFKRWITHDVLPSIRETGAYAQPGATDLIPPPFKIAGLRPNQRLKAMEMAWRMTQMDLADRQAMLEYYATLCETVAGPVNHPVDNGLTEFLQTRCIFDPDGLISKSNLYDAYTDFVAEAGELRLGREQFFRKLYQNKGLSTSRPRLDGKRRWYIKGLTLIN